MIEQIKEALEKATPGTWSEGVKQVSEPQENYREILAGKGFFGDKKKHQGFGITGLISPADAHLIANTPTYIRYLLDELEKAQKHVQELEYENTQLKHFKNETKAAKDNLIFATGMYRVEVTKLREELQTIKGETNHE